MLDKTMVLLTGVAYTITSKKRTLKDNGLMIWKNRVVL